ncbi:hypothetical protein KPA07_05190 [Corynebacterium aurimucosum]|uniref:hypothetical protein n=1 Tax=Corynebacterium aurimucosum TaxID=169292 RepID=UPI001C0E95AB|nr:hypothetical protein [Corynebacterium aurimucosum]MBU5654308.1 hypothetical protein [Corynebacterium aurimucosum]
MASLSNVESIVNSIAKGISTSVKTKFTNTDSGYASANGSFANGTRFNVIDIDETKTTVCNLAKNNDEYVELSMRQSRTNSYIANNAVKAYAAI